MPASGRRGGWTVSTGFLVLLGFNALFAGTFFPAFAFAALDGMARPILVVAGVLLVVTLVLIPRPNRSAALLRGRSAALLGAGVGILAAGFIAVRTGADATPKPAARAPAQRLSVLRVATYNVRRGFRSWLAP